MAGAGTADQPTEGLCDAMLAAVAEHLCYHHGLSVPASTSWKRS